MINLSIDTVNLRIPLDFDSIKRLEESSTNIRKLDCGTGELHYSVNFNSFIPSWDYNVNINFYNVSYIVIRVSLAKLIHGHNIINNGFNLINDLNVLKSKLEIDFNIELCDVEDWECTRIDISHNYYMATEKDVYTYLEIIKNSSYPRREPIIHHGISFKGTTSTIKFYPKHKEYMKHDYKRLRPNYKDKALKLKQLSKGVLRIEVEIKAKKLQSIVGSYKIKDIDNHKSLLFWFFESEVKKVLKTNIVQFKLLTSLEEVERLVNSKCSTRLAPSVMNTYYQIHRKGFKLARGDFEANNKIRSFQRHIKILKELNVSLLDSDINFVNTDNNTYSIINYDLFNEENSLRCVI